MRKRNKVNQKGRSSYTSDQYIKITYHMIKHPNFCALNGSAIKVLLFLCTRHNGFNNGRISMSYDEMVQFLHMGKSTAYRACEGLEYYGFVKMAKRGTFYGRKATEWEITFLKSEGYHPTNDWKEQKCRKGKKRKKALSASIADAIISENEYKKERRRKIDSRYQNET